MSVEGTSTHERVFRPALWRYLAYRFVLIAATCAVALGAVRLMETRFPIPHLRGLDLAIVGSLYFFLDAIYAVADRNRFALRLSPWGVAADRGLQGRVFIPWSQFDWRATQRRGMLDRLLGQSYIFGTAGQRILWQPLVHPPGDVRAILAELARQGETEPARERAVRE